MALLQPANQIEVVVEWQIGMQTSDDVKLGGASGHAFGGAQPHLFQRVGVRPGCIGDRPKAHNRQ